MNKKVIIFFSILAILLVGGLIAYFIAQQIPRSPEDVGNLAGNIHNGGYFCEMDGKVYFVNVSDNNCLYSMNLDESEPKRLTSMRVLYVNAANGYLYFYMDSTKKSSNVSGLGSVSNQYGIYRCKKDGSDQTCLLRDFCGEVQLCGEYIYYQGKLDGGTLGKIRVDKQNKAKVLDEMASPACFDKGVIYYTGVAKDHNIHALNTLAGDTVSDVLSGNLFFPVKMGDYLYYMDGTQNYCLKRTNLMNGQTEIVIQDRLDCFTMDNQHIYYCHSKELDSTLNRCDLDGSNQFILYQGIVNSLNLTSKYLYFKVYGHDEVMYHIPLDGSAGVSVFTTD